MTKTYHRQSMQAIQTYNSSLPIFNIPAEIEIKLFQYLTPFELVQASGTCQRWNFVINHRDNGKALWVFWAKIFHSAIYVHLFRFISRVEGFPPEVYYPPYNDEKSQVMALLVSGRDYLKRFSELRKALEREDNPSANKQDALIDLLFASTLVQLASNGKFCRAAVKYRGNISDASFIDRTLSVRGNLFLKLNIKDERFETFKNARNDPYRQSHFTLYPEYEKIIHFSKENKLSDAIALLEKNYNLIEAAVNRIELNNILAMLIEKAVDLGSIETLWRIYHLMKFRVPSASNNLGAIFVSYNLKELPSIVKYKAYQLFKENPEFNPKDDKVYCGVFPYLSDFHEDHVLSLCKDGYEQEAFDLFNILYVVRNNKESNFKKFHAKEKCLNLMISWFKLIQAPIYVQKAQALLDHFKTQPK